MDERAINELAALVSSLSDEECDKLITYIKSTTTQQNYRTA